MIANKEDAIKYIESKKDGAIFEITEKRQKSLRSLAQNRYYFLILDIIADFHGNTILEQHELIKMYFKIETTTNLEVDEFTFLIESIRDLWKTKFGLRIPLPNEADIGELEKYLF